MEKEEGEKCEAKGKWDCENGRHFEAFVARDGSKGCSPVVTGGDAFPEQSYRSVLFSDRKSVTDRNRGFYRSWSLRRERIATLFSPGFCLTSQVVAKTDERRIDESI